MKKKFLVALLLIACVICATCFYAAANDWSFLESLGSQSRVSSDSTVLAEYNGLKVTQAMVDRQQSATKLSASGADVGTYKIDTSSKAIVERILTGQMLLEEAESKGLAATEAEIEEHVATLKKGYSDYPEVKKQVDEYCDGAGLSIDEYWAQVREQAYGTISRSKLKADFEKEYCDSVGYTGSTETQEYADMIEKAFDEHRSELLKAHESEVRYYGSTAK